MPFEKGHSNGRPIGSKNKATELKKIISQVGTSFTAEEIIEYLRKMSPRSRVDALMHVWKYLEPTKKAIEVAEVSDEEKKEEYIQRLMDIPLENYNKLHGKN